MIIYTGSLVNKELFTDIAVYDVFSSAYKSTDMKIALTKSLNEIIFNVKTAKL